MLLIGANAQEHLGLPVAGVCTGVELVHICNKSLTLDTFLCCMLNRFGLPIDAEAGLLPCTRHTNTQAPKM